MTGSTAESDLRGDTRRARVLLKSDSGSECMFCGKSKPVIHYPVFISTKTRKQSQVSLFSKRISISILFTTLSIYFTMCLPRQRRQKCLLAPTNVTSDEARRRQFGVAVFHESRINPQAHGIPLWHFTREYTRVSFIFP